MGTPIKSNFLTAIQYENHKNLSQNSPYPEILFLNIILYRVYSIKKIVVIVFSIN